MEKFLAYFDVLGFKDFIENNTEKHIEKYMEHLLRESQYAASGQIYKDGKPGNYIPDLSKSKINCLHVSDSIIFWSDDVSTESFKNIIECSTCFFRNIILGEYFAVRGCIVAGNMIFKPFQISNENEISFNNSSLYGKALVDAYTRAEAQNWAGCYIDKSAIEKVDESIIDRFIYESKVAYYAVPLKADKNNFEYALTIISSSMNNVHFKNRSNQIERIFKIHAKDKPISESVRIKMTNTIKFLDYFRENGLKNTNSLITQKNIADNSNL